MLDPILEYSKSNPNKIAIRSKTKTITYKELNNQINNYFHYYENKLTENKIAISIKDPIEFIKTFWALTRLGKQLFLLNNLTPGFNKTLLHEYKIKTHLNKKTTSNIPDHLIKESYFKTKKTKIYIFTSGSTTLPKCVMHSINNFIISAHHVSQKCKFTPKSKWLLNLPMFHVSGLGIMFRSFLNNTELLTGNLNDFNSITHISCVEKQLNLLINFKIKSLQCILVGGSKISETLINNALEKNLPIYKTYGLTETASAITISKLTKNTSHTSGECLAHSKIKIKNKFIYIQSESLAKSYLTKTSTKKLTYNNWFKTNDLGYIENNNLVVTQRADSIIIINGENISLETIENTLNKHPKVIESKVISIKQNNTQQICGFIKSRQKLNSLTKELNNLIQKELSTLFVPKKYFKLNNSNKLKPSKHDLIIHAKTNYELEDS